ncbi:MAG: hypothetical protein J2P37_24520 [Ktedonobacteraceae bacterium]|nr:hypothetical protein [Ktedonobacteraceae bacterium]
MDGKTKGFIAAGVAGAVLAGVALHENTDPLPSKTEFSLCRQVADEHTHKDVVQRAGKLEVDTHSDANGQQRVDITSGIPGKMLIEATLTDGNHINTSEELEQRDDHKFFGNWPVPGTWKVRSVTNLEFQSAEDGAGACNPPLDIDSKEKKAPDGTTVQEDVPIRKE